MPANSNRQKHWTKWPSLRDNSEFGKIAGKMNKNEMLEMNIKDLAHHHYLCAWFADHPEKKVDRNKTQSMTTSFNF